MNFSLDKSGMRQIILDFPRQFAEGIKAARDAKPSLHKEASSVIVAGMGGSALPGELLKLLAARIALFKKPTAVHVHRNYGLPHYASKRNFIVCISYSGNTAETLSAYKEARKQKIPLAVIASGGKLAR